MEQHGKGDTSNESKKGTFLKSFGPSILSLDGIAGED